MAETATTVEARLAGLTPGTTYHYRLVAHNWLGTATGSDATFKTSGWSTTPTAKVQGERSQEQLKGLSCLTTTNCTAVGFYQNSEYVLQTLIEAWNGSSWSLQASPNPSGAGGSFLEGISCSAANACTATGHWEDSKADLHTLAERWNGSSWTVEAPLTKGTSTTLDSVACPTATECYAAGWYTVTSTAEHLPLVEKWNGATWKTVTLATRPAEDKEGWLHGISCTAAASCMVVGTYDSETEGLLPLAERLSAGKWKWSPVPRPDHGLETEFGGIACISETNCTAVGNYNDVNGPGEEALIDQFNGSTWSVESSPSPTGEPAGEGTSWQLTQISCASGSSCVTTGTYVPGEGQPTLLLGEAWDGRAWSLDPPLDRTPAERNVFGGLSCPSTTTCLAAGWNERSRNESESLVEELEQSP